MAVATAAAGVLSPLPARAAGPVVSDVRVAQHGPTTRVVLDLSRDVTVTMFTLADPYRVVLDMPEVGWRLPQQPLPQSVGHFKRIRYGLFKPGVSRVVLDLASPVLVQEFTILPPPADAPVGGAAFRLVVDLAATTDTAFRGAIRKRRNLDSPKVAVAAVGPAVAPVVTPTVTSTVTPVATARPAPGAPIRKAAFPYRVPPLKPARVARPHVVVIDPGHGGADPGAIGVSGIYEKYITLAVAREVEAQLEATGQFKVVLTRDRDKFVRLRSRVDLARAADGELFISIHADTIRDRDIRGLSVYTLSEKASDREAEALAEKENKADLIGGVDLSAESAEVTNILIDLAQRETMNESVRFASVLVKSLRHETRLLRNTHRFAGFAVLKAPDIPSVLVELGFLSNRQDERSLRRSDYRVRLAKAISRAVKGYFVRIEEAARE
ncbi:MAG: N-acetylmuramoyl-L-alanine amidase [Hyphomicrobiales bacterium]|nr:N-acetylmuramoyl-L-alanine amidase [Hyphomicrobiales bacterium]